ncbi:calmodulin-like membrane associated Ca(2+)-binding protein [Rhodopirellula maiorica SM1]|uniref:Calmodulin-like membrane associated Ca(2+)-binding protein n=1 Tax=Rhodopirellula maiorica SM1 TaxID=1265738 RepID=M5RG11_9BACT|nr:calmodulin-like membrane associated Ca(2+)-binding protein [Rhodopirellula maiorica SM1]
MIVAVAFAIGLTVCVDTASAQSGLRESLERLDTDGDGDIDPSEITPLARPYMERVAAARRMSLERAYGVDKWQEAARIYYAMNNGVSRREVDVDDYVNPMDFGTAPDQPLVPEFGLPEVKYPYTQADLEYAERTLRRSDRNRDGYIDRVEAQREEWRYRDPFSEDFNNDNKLSRLELAQRYARRRMLSGAASELTKKAERTGNGVAASSSRRSESSSRDRYRGRPGSRDYLTSTVLGRFDSDRNGRLSADEAVRLGVPFGRLDVDRDGEIQRGELQAYLGEMQAEAGDLTVGLPGWFYERDLNRDNQVAMDEYTDEWTDELIEEFRSYDSNGDGLLTASEAISAKSLVGGSYRSDSVEALPPRKTVVSEIYIDENYLIADLDVQLSITHTYTSFLDGYLIGPDGTRIELFSGVGAHDDHFDQTIFDDSARYSITKGRPPFEGSFQPEALAKRQPGLSAFNGKSVQGPWQLVISGTQSDRFGILHGWGLTVRPQPQFPGESNQTISEAETSNENAIETETVTRSTTADEPFVNAN